MKTRLLFLCFFGTLATSSAQEITFSEHIAPIIYNNCTSCHRPGEVAPIPFTNYDEVSAFGTTIQYVTQINYMPPWPPNRDYSNFIGERFLTDEEIQLISTWVDGGMPQGDPALEPDLPVFQEGSQIGTPDMVITMEESYTIAGNNQDDYRVFVLPTNFGEDREIASLEFRPGNNRAVHHVLFGYDESGAARIRDNQSPDVYGYQSFGDFGINQAVYLSWGYVPGAPPLVYPEGIGQTLPAGADLLIQVHYAPLPSEETDQSSINIFFKDTDDPIQREIRQAMVLPDDLPGGWGSFWLQAETVPTFTAQGWENRGLNTFNQDVSLISVLPHAHYLGTSYQIYAITPDDDTLNIIDIPEWDFNWQGAYTLDRMLKIPAGSRLITKASYDNTSTNPNNPSNPPIGVGWGDGTQDEMFVTFFYYVPYQEGDEDIIIGDMTSEVASVSPTGSELQSPAPNPVNDEFSLSFMLQRNEMLTFDLFNAAGQRVGVLSPKQEWPAGTHQLSLSVEDFSAGAYFVRMSGQGYGLTRPLIIAR